MPITVETWPGPMKRVDAQPGRLEDRAQRRLDRDVVAEDGEVRRSLGACSQQRHRGRRRRRLEADREEDDAPVGQLRGERERVERRVDHAHVRAAGLRLEQRAAAARDAHHVAEGRERDAGLLGEGDRVVDAAHRDHADGAAGAVHELDLGRQQVLEAVAVDRVGVPAADLHDPHRLAGPHERRDLGRERRGRARPSGTRRRTSRSARSARARSRRGRAGRRPGRRRGRGRSRRARAAPAISTIASTAVDRDDARLDRLVRARDAALVCDRRVIPCPAAARRARAAARRRARAAPASRARRPRRCARARSRRGSAPSRRPRAVADGSSTSAMLTSRRTPEMSTFARPASRSTISITCPGIPRHMTQRCRCDRRLTVTDAAVVRRHEPVGEDAEARLLEPACAASRAGAGSGSCRRRGRRCRGLRPRRTGGCERRRDALVEGGRDLGARPSCGEVVVDGSDEVGAENDAAVDRQPYGVRRRVAGQVLELDRGLALVAHLLAHAEQRGDCVEETARARGERRVHLQALAHERPALERHGPLRRARDRRRPSATAP